MPLYSLGKSQPEIDESCWIAPNAQVMGRVVLRARVTVWFGAVLRGDMEDIFIGEGTNIQDLSMLHADPSFVLSVGSRVTVGHRAILHGCTIEDESMIGMGAVVLNGAHIGKHCLIGANTLIPEGKQIPDGSIVLGSPGKVVREVDEGTIAMIQMAAEHYAKNGQRFNEELKQL